MSRLNWTGLVMLIVAFLFPVLYPGEMELLFGLNTWDGMWYEMETGAVIAAVTYLLVGGILTVWPTLSDKHD